MQHTAASDGGAFGSWLDRVRAPFAPVHWMVNGLMVALLFPIADPRLELAGPMLAFAWACAWIIIEVGFGAVAAGLVVLDIRRRAFDPTVVYSLIFPPAAAGFLIFVLRVQFVRFTGLLVLVLALAAPAGAATRTRPVNYISPVVSADGGTIYFVGDGPTGDNLYSIHVDGTAERRLTHDGGRLPRWVGVPGRITFAGVGGDSGRVFSFSGWNGAKRAIVAVPGRSPVLSPDGARVAYLVGPWKAAELRVANADGTGEHRVAGGGEAAAWNPAWSPDGRRLAYTFAAPERRVQVHVADAMDAAFDTVVTDTLAKGAAAQMPAWSPDARRLAVQWSTEEAAGSRIAIVDLPTRAIRVLDLPVPASVDRVSDEVPSWFPDGKRIVFQSNRGGNVDIWVVNADGTDLRQVTGRRR